MEEKKSALFLPVLVLVVLAVGGYLFLQKNGGSDLLMKTSSTPAPETGTGLSSGNASDAVTPDDIVASIEASATEEATLADPTDDATLVGNDTEEISNYENAYDATNF